MHKYIYVFCLFFIKVFAVEARTAVSSDVFAMEARTAISSDVFAVEARTAISSDVFDVELRTAVSSDVFDDQGERRTSTRSFFLGAKNWGRLISLTGSRN